MAKTKTQKVNIFTPKQKKGKAKAKKKANKHESIKKYRGQGR